MQGEQRFSNLLDGIVTNEKKKERTKEIRTIQWLKASSQEKVQRWNKVFREEQEEEVEDW